MVFDLFFSNLSGLLLKIIEIKQKGKTKWRLIWKENTLTITQCSPNENKILNYLFVLVTQIHEIYNLLVIHFLAVAIKHSHF